MCPNEEERSEIFAVDGPTTVSSVLSKFTSMSLLFSLFLLSFGVVCQLFVCCLVS